MKVYNVTIYFFFYQKYAEFNLHKHIEMHAAADREEVEEKWGNEGEQQAE